MQHSHEHQHPQLGLQQPQPGLGGAGAGAGAGDSGVDGAMGGMEGDELMKWACSKEGCEAIQQYVSSHNILSYHGLCHPLSLLVFPVVQIWGSAADTV